MNFLFYFLRSWQRIWLGHIPGTEKPPASIQPPHGGQPGPPARGQDRSLMGREQFRTKDLRLPLGTASEANSIMLQLPLGTSLLLWSSERGVSGSWLPTPTSPRRPGKVLPHPKPCVHSPRPSVNLVGPCGLRLLCSTSFPIPGPWLGSGLSLHCLGHFTCVALGSTCSPSLSLLSEQ